MNCKTAEELAKAIKNNEESIIIEGDLKNKVIRIKATGKVSWGGCAVSLAAAVVFYKATPAAAATMTPAAGTVSLVSGVGATTVAAATIGSAVVPAIAIGVAAGGVGALNALRDKYKIVEKTDAYIKLKRN